MSDQPPADHVLLTLGEDFHVEGAALCLTDVGHRKMQVLHAGGRFTPIRIEIVSNTTIAVYPEPGDETVH